MINSQLEQIINDIRSALFRNLERGGFGVKTKRDSVFRYRGLDDSTKRLIRQIRDDQPDEGYGLGLAILYQHEKKNDYVVLNLEIDSAIRRINLEGGAIAVRNGIYQKMLEYFNDKSRSVANFGFAVGEREIESGTRGKGARYAAQFTIPLPHGIVRGRTGQFEHAVTATAYALLKGFDYAIQEIMAP